VGNDYGYEYVFSRYLEAQAKPGDVLLAISTSGKSANVIKAAEHARANGMKIITLTGQSNSALGKLADIDVCTPVGKYADRVQELHIKVIHILIELVERQLFPSNYA
jgi:D-sedoheptulose 7-phosphate isomerase